MSWFLLIGVALALGLLLLVTLARRAELAGMHGHVRAREQAAALGHDKAKLQHPVVDLSRCLGCGTCVAVCPEENVLELVHGQALVVNGARCQGISACERECPVGAITVTLTELEERRDVPVLDEQLEAVGSPNLFLAGEVTAHALIKTAIEHGVAVADAVALRVERARRAEERAPGGTSLHAPARRAATLAADGAARGRSTMAAPSAMAAPSVATLGSPLAALLERGAPEEPGSADEELDLCIVGAGPAGLACSLEAKRRGLAFVTIDQEAGAGGTVAKYPRRKLVMTQPVDLPLVGRLASTSYEKEELVELWRSIVHEHELPLVTGETFLGLERDAEGSYLVSTSAGVRRARHVCLAIGRRGTPRKLGVPGEDLPKVAFSLLDARSYVNRRVLVVGGGDSAVETALGLAEQPGNQVTLSYRNERFFRIRGKNEERLRASASGGNLRVLLRSEVVSIAVGSVELVQHGDAGPVRTMLANDEVFVMAGGVAPLELLGRAGVSFDPSLRPPPAPILEQGTGLVRALTIGFTLALLALGFALSHADYYGLPMGDRPAHAKHALLRPGLGIGLFFGIASAALIAVNLLYLVRRSMWLGFRWGALRTWMTGHVATGILAFLLATLHAAMAPRDTVGGHAFTALAVLLVTGAVGRYFYAWVPRAANGRELELAEVRASLGRVSEAWDQGQRRFRERVRQEIGELMDARQWRSSLAGRALALCGVQLDLRRALERLAREGRAQGVAEDQIHETMQLARRAWRAALVTAHYEDLRALLNAWRYLHRWVAALMVILVLLHVVYALTYGAHFFEDGP